MVHIKGIDIGQAPDRVPGHLGKVVVAEIQILQCGQEVIKGMGRYGVQLVVGQDQMAKVGQAFEMVILVGVEKRRWKGMYCDKYPIYLFIYLSIDIHLSVP